jgi:hypothetical protein
MRTLPASRTRPSLAREGSGGGGGQPELRAVAATPQSRPQGRCWPQGQRRDRAEAGLLAGHHSSTGAELTTERTGSLRDDSDGSSLHELVAACCGIAACLLLATGWPLVWAWNWLGGCR